MSGSAAQLPRLLALVPYLLSHPGARITEVAALFGVTERQLRTDLNLLWMCGLPGHGPGDLIDMVWHPDGRVTLTEATTIDRPLRLSTDEALALVVALRALANVPGLTDRDALDRVTAKLEHAAGSAAAGTDADRVVVAAEPVSGALLGRVRAGLDGGRRLRLTYHGAARDDVTEREVDPMRLVLADGHTYLEGWCRRAEGVRLFRLDRVLDVAVLPVPAAPPPAAQPRDLADGLFQPPANAPLVELLLAPGARWVADYYPCERVTETGDGAVRVLLRVGDPAWVRRLVLGLGGTARVLAPDSLADEVADTARAALAAYESPDRGEPAGPPGVKDRPGPAEA